MFHHQRQVFSGRHEAEELGYVDVHIAMLERLQDRLVNQSIERNKIHDAPRLGIKWTLYAHIQHIVVPVPKRVGALAKNGAVLRFGNSSENKRCEAEKR